MSNVDNTLQERGTRYGEFHDQAEYAQDMKAIFQRSPNWAKMTADQREGLEMIANKIGRILNGDPNYTDSWHDISGYAQLVEKRIEQREKAKEKVRHEANFQVDRYLIETSQDAPARPVSGMERGKILGLSTLRPEGQVD